MERSIVHHKSTLTQAEIQEKEVRQEAFVFGHSLTDMIRGQLQLGFQMVDFIEDDQPNPRFVIDHYLPTFMATLMVKE